MNEKWIWAITIVCLLSVIILTIIQINQEKVTCYRLQEPINKIVSENVTIILDSNCWYACLKNNTWEYHLYRPSCY